MKNYWPAWITSFIVTVITLTLAGYFFHVPNMIRLELAPDPETMSAYIQSINPTPEHSFEILYMNTVVDYAFLTAYSFLTFFSFRILLSAFDAPVGKWVYIISGLTGFFDILENSFLINSSLRYQEDFWMLYYYIVRVKWACAIIPIMIIPAVLSYGFLVLLTREKIKIKKKKNQ